MTSKTFTLAAVLLATSTLTSVANAGGVRLSMAGPLGSFVAHPHQSSGPGGTLRGYAAKPHCNKPAYVKPSYVGRFKHDNDEAPARKVKRVVPKVEVAEEAPAPRNIKKAQKIEVSEEAPVEVKTAKLEDKTTATDAAPAIFVPASPPVSDVTGTQSTPSPERSAALAPTAATTTVTATEPAVQKPETTAAVTPVEAKAVETKPAETKTAKAEKASKDGSVASKLCRRFSAAVAGLVSVPCNE